MKSRDAFFALASVLALAGCDGSKSPSGSGSTTTVQAPAKMANGVCHLEHAPPRYPDCGAYAFLDTEGTCVVPEVIFMNQRGGPSEAMLGYCAALQIKYGPR
jgi:hypothetical protein